MNTASIGCQNNEIFRDCGVWVSMASNHDLKSNTVIPARRNMRSPCDRKDDSSAAAEVDLTMTDANLHAFQIRTESDVRRSVTPLGIALDFSRL